MSTWVISFREVVVDLFGYEKITVSEQVSVIPPQKTQLAPSLEGVSTADIKTEIDTGVDKIVEKFTAFQTDAKDETPEIEVPDFSIHTTKSKD